MRAVAVDCRGGKAETLVHCRLSREELELLISLTAEQLFRRSFVEQDKQEERRCVGELRMGKRLLARLERLRQPGLGESAVRALSGGDLPRMEASHAI